MAEIWQDAKTSLDFSIGKYYTQSGTTFLQRMITLPDDVRVLGSHSVSIDGSGMIRITFYPAAVDLGRERLDELKNVIPFKVEKPPNAPATRRAPNQVGMRRRTAAAAWLAPVLATMHLAWAADFWCATVSRCRRMLAGRGQTSGPKL